MIEGTKTYKGKIPVPVVVREEESPKDISKTGLCSTNDPSSERAIPSPESPSSPKPPAEATPSSPSSALPNPQTDAVNLGRRKWMSSLVPAFGEGLVKILRESNHLKSELHEALKEKSKEITKSAQSLDSQDDSKPRQ